MKRSQSSYPDRSEIFAHKTMWRDQRARLTFAEKLDLLDELKERTQPIVESRLIRNKQSETRRPSR